MIRVTHLLFPLLLLEQAAKPKQAHLVGDPDWPRSTTITTLVEDRVILNDSLLDFPRMEFDDNGIIQTSSASV